MPGYISQNERSADSLGKTAESSSLDRWLLARLWQSVGSPQICLALWDGFSVGDDDAVTVTFHDRSALYRLLHKPTYTFGLLFTAGRISVSGDLIAAMEHIYRGLNKAQVAKSAVSRLLDPLAAKRPRTNSQLNARDNIYAHYDLGNEFYELWLDRDFQQYTCAYYAQPDYSLEQAQTAKLEYLCRKLALQPGETVLEAGSGWGGLGRYLARYYGVKVRAYNISASQVAYARQKAKEENLAHAIEYVEDDYRNVTGSYDAYVSVGMLEHVGPDNYAALGESIDRCLKPDGRGLIHSIGQISPRLLNEWIERTIFPGAQPGSLAQMLDIFEPRDLIVTDVENLGPHYALALKDWYARFEQNTDKVVDMFDADFARAWRLYLAGSAAAFTAGNLQLYQIVFRRAQCKALPDTRASLYLPGLASNAQQSYL